ncbi:MAG: universal stress protein [Nitrospirales bacterium]|nr:universal stress protein [Nitrospirales bacterium]
MRTRKGVKKMLVAIDGSESGMNALSQAFKLAAQEKSWITVVCVVPPYQGDLDIVGVGNVMEAMRKPCEDALAEAEKMAKASGALIKPVCEEGDAYERIVALADAENAELIVMGRRGISGLERVLVGSVTARVIGHSQRDVLVIPRTATEVTWKKILLTIDGSKYSVAAIERAIDFAEGYGGELKILSVVDVPAEFYGEAPGILEDMVQKAKGYVQEAQKKAEARGIRAEVLVREGETHQVIVDAAKDLQADAVIVGSHGRTGLKRLLMGSVTEKVIGYAHCPVLGVRA